MLRAFSVHGGSIEIDATGEQSVAQNAIWIDLLSPSVEEEELVEHAVGLAIPTREDMVEIEPSSRLYQDNGALHLTASVMAGVHTGVPRTVPVTFVLTRDRLVTVRYDDPKSFQAFIAHVGRQPDLCRSAASTLVFLLDAVVERAADILEAAAMRTDGVSRDIFHRERGPTRKRMTNETLEDILLEIGGAQDILLKVRESLSSMARLISYLVFALPQYDKSEVAHLKTVARDCQSARDLDPGSAFNADPLHSQ